MFLNLKAVDGKKSNGYFIRRLHYTSKLRPNEGGILITGVAPSTLHFIPPYQKEYKTAGYCSLGCTKEVSYFLQELVLLLFASVMVCRLESVQLYCFFLGDLENWVSKFQACFLVLVFAYCVIERICRFETFYLNTFTRHIQSQESLYTKNQSKL